MQSERMADMSIKVIFICAQCEPFSFFFGNILNSSCGSASDRKVT